MEYTVPVYHALPLFTDKILAVPFVQKCWDVGKFCVGKVGTFVTDFRNVEGNVSILLERKYTGYMYSVLESNFKNLNRKISNISNP